jgi:hypothetical protein
MVMGMIAASSPAAAVVSRIHFMVPERRQRLMIAQPPMG